MITKNENYVVENINGVDGPLISKDVSTNSSKKENLCLKHNSLLENKILEFAIIQVQVAFWKPHNEGSIAWGFFAMNDDLLVHLENLQML
jgi:hypothetical protein